MNNVVDQSVVIVPIWACICQQFRHPTKPLFHRRVRKVTRMPSRAFAVVTFRSRRPAYWVCFPPQTVRRLAPSSTNGGCQARWIYHPRECADAEIGSVSYSPGEGYPDGRTAFCVGTVVLCATPRRGWTIGDVWRNAAGDLIGCLVSEQVEKASHQTPNVLPERTQGRDLHRRAVRARQEIVRKWKSGEGWGRRLFPASIRDFDP